MKLIIREFIGQLRESGELDRLLPDLLARMKIIPVSKPQIGVRQNGVDIAAVGRDEAGIKTLFLFVLKIGNVGRTDWDVGVNAIRSTLNQIKDSYLPAFVQPEHRGLPIKIVVCTTGDLRQEVIADFNGYTAKNSEANLKYEFWSGDRLAELIDAHLLDEYAINPSERSNLRRSIALIGTKDYDLRHAYELFRGLLLDEKREYSQPLISTERKLFIRNLKTAALALEIIFHWAEEEGNLLNAMLAGERCSLWSWEAIRSRKLLEYRPAKSAFAAIYVLHNRICHAYFSKLAKHCYVRDAMSLYSSESSLVANKIFEQIGLLSEIGILQLREALSNGDEKARNNAVFVAETIVALIRNNPGSSSPRFDGHAIEISLCALLLISTGKIEDAKYWIDKICDRLIYCYRRSKWFPIATDSMDDLVAFDIGELDETEIKRLRDLSTLVPTVMYWCAALGHDELYKKMQSIQKSVFEDVCLQLWYPDEETDSYIYRGPAQIESGTTEAPIFFPESIANLIEISHELAESNTVPDISFSSAVQNGLFSILLIACRHFRTPFPPQFWLPFLSQWHSTTDVLHKEEGESKHLGVNMTGGSS